MGEQPKIWGLTERVWDIICVVAVLIFIGGAALVHHNFIVNHKYGKRGLHCLKLPEPAQQECRDRVVGPRYGRRPAEAK